MIWSPNPVVTIDGVDYSGDTLASVQVTGGRPDTTQQPQAGYANLTLLELGSSSPAFTLGADLVITVEDSNGDPQPVFTGTVSDIATQVISTSIDGYVTTFSVLAVGPLARLNRRTAGGSGYPSQGDGDRIMAILAEIYAARWNQQPALLAWNGVTSTLTWDTFDAYIGTIDQPGLYTLASYAADETNGYELTGIAALSGLGVLHETADGLINYDDADHRTDNAILNGYLDLPTSIILARGLETTTRLGDIVNIITVEYASGSVTATDQTSVDQLGPASETYTTVLANALDAADQADRYLALNASPVSNFETLYLPLTAVDITAALLDDLIGVYCGLPIRITNLPGTVGNSFTGFIEGWKWTLTDNTADLQIAISDFSKSAVTTKWRDVTASTAWNALPPTDDWQESLVIA